MIKVHVGLGCRVPVAGNEDNTLVKVALHQDSLKINPPKLDTIDLCCDWNRRHIYVFAHRIDSQEDETMSEPAPASLVDDNFIRPLLKQIMSDYGCWNELEYGLWIVLNGD